MSEIRLTVPDKTLITLKTNSSESAAVEVRLAAAVKLYELSRLSSKAAATLASIPRTLFLNEARRLQRPDLPPHQGRATTRLLMVTPCSQRSSPLAGFVAQ